MDGRVVLMCALAVGVGIAGGFAARLLMALMGAVTNLAYYGRWSFALVSPANNLLGWFAIGVPVFGALVVGVMARLGSSAIRGHGIPEVMERVLYGESRIPARLLFLKPLSAAIAIGTGGPFGAEGPIIATGGALGSLVGQAVRVTADERKTLLAAGAAAGMAGTFGSPVSAVLLAVELLLFEYRPRSLVPVAIASAVAAAVRIAFEGSTPIFAVPDLIPPSATALWSYAALGAAIGVVAAGITRLVYGLEDLFARLPIHWMWWPALGALVVGVVGMFEPRTLGVGYDNITAALSGTLAGRVLLVLVLLKLLSWSVYLASGTSGGTLAPLFTIGAGVGACVGELLSWLAPWLNVDPRIAALVGMAAIFAGASHALLASVVFAFETTRQPLGLLPLLAGCAAAYLVSLMLSRHSIMTEKLARRGAHVHTEYIVDPLSCIRVREAAVRDVVTLRAGQTLEQARRWLASGATGTGHQGFPVLDDAGLLVGLVTRRDLFDASYDATRTLASLVRRAPAVVYDESTLREAADHMVLEEVGRLPVVTRAEPRRVVGIVTRSDLLLAHAPRLRAARTLDALRSAAS
jgi:chloride channel protein, CIC family